MLIMLIITFSSAVLYGQKGKERMVMKADTVRSYSEIVCSIELNHRLY